MPDGHDAEPVTYGRWHEAHRALSDRVTALEQDVRSSQWESVHRMLASQITDLRADFEEFTKTAGETVAKRRDRQWAIIIVFLTGFALPLIVVALVAVFNAHVH